VGVAVILVVVRWRLSSVARDPAKAAPQARSFVAETDQTRKELELIQKDLAELAALARWLILAWVAGVGWFAVNWTSIRSEPEFVVTAPELAKLAFFSAPVIGVFGVAFVFYYALQPLTVSNPRRGVPVLDYAYVSWLVDRCIKLRESVQVQRITLSISIVLMVIGASLLFAALGYRDTYWVAMMLVLAVTSVVVFLLRLRFG
jgi:hypothetical protein